MKDKIIFDATEFADSDKIGAYLLDDSGNLISSTDVGGSRSLNVAVLQSALPTGAATESTLADILADTANIDANIADILADTANIDSVLSALSKAEDSAHTSGDQGIQILAVRNDTGGSLVDTDGDYGSLQLDSEGRLRVAAEVDINAEYEEDSAHTSGDIGNFTLAVRNDADSSMVSDDGDYAPFQVNATGRLKTESQIVAPNNAVLSQAVSVDDTAGGTALPTTALSSRKVLWVQNNDSKAVALGASGVTFASGFILSPGSVAKVDLGPGVTLYAIAEAGKTVNVRVMEQS